MSEPNPYAAPEYGASTPVAPAYGAPAYGTPAHGAPVPAYGTPAYPAPPAQAYASTSAYAGWGSRVGAYLLDQVFMIPFAIPYLVGFGLLFANLREDGTMGSDGVTVAGIALVGIGGLVMLAGVIWNRYVLGGRGQSWGKKKLGLWLVSSSTGRPIGGGMAFVRDLAHLLDSWSMMIGYLWPLWDERRQTFADKVCSTVVITAAPR